MLEIEPRTSARLPYAFEIISPDHKWNIIYNLLQEDWIVLPLCGDYSCLVTRLSYLRETYFLYDVQGLTLHWSYSVTMRL